MGRSQLQYQRDSSPKNKHSVIIYSKPWWFFFLCRTQKQKFLFSLLKSYEICVRNRLKCLLLFTKKSLIQPKMTHLLHQLSLMQTIWLQKTNKLHWPLLWPILHPFWSLKALIFWNCVKNNVQFIIQKGSFCVPQMKVFWVCDEQI